MRASATFALLAACAGIGMTFGGPPWTKLDKAKVLAQETGRAIAVFATVDGKDASGC